MADLVLVHLGAEPFSWGRANLTDAGSTRRRYVVALRAADRHDIGPLLAFVRS
jgi:hypothetical protein